MTWHEKPPTGAGAAGPNAKIAAEVPATIKAKGSLVVASDATYAPMEFIGSDGHTVVGADADLAAAIGGVLGLKFKVTNASFDTIIPGLSAGKYDIVERGLADVGAEFYFDRVLIMPGQPLVCGQARDKFFFGLPGNPASTMVTFEIFARSAV